jgi:hypothetical protein
VDIPGVAWPEGVKKVPLPDHFPPLSLGVLYTGELKPIAAHFLQLVKKKASRLKKDLKKTTSS